MVWPQVGEEGEMTVAAIALNRIVGLRSAESVCSLGAVSAADADVMPWSSGNNHL